MRPSRATAALLAKDLLADQPGRLAHVGAVAARAEEVCRELSFADDVLVSAAWLHDIGYAPQLATTGFHPIDGAKFVRDAGYSVDVVGLVAYHSCAEVEAEERGCAGELAGGFARPDVESLALLTYCDMTVGPLGERMSVDERLEDILERYDADDVVHRSILCAAPGLCSIIAHVGDLLEVQSQ